MKNERNLAPKLIDFIPVYRCYTYLERGNYYAETTGEEIKAHGTVLTMTAYHMPILPLTFGLTILAIKGLESLVH